MNPVGHVMRWFHNTKLGQALIRNKAAIAGRRQKAARLIDATMVNIDASRAAARKMTATAKTLHDDDGFVGALRRLEEDLKSEQR